jgi:hypothetical protein
LFRAVLSYEKIINYLVDFHKGKKALKTGIIGKKGNFIFYPTFLF